jgi:hypothetical protein
MHRQHTLSMFRSFVIVVVSVMVVNFTIEALVPNTNSGPSYQVIASVEPTRYIVVDRNLQIKQIVSNTAEDVVPYVLLNSLDGKPLPYTNSIRTQFLALKSSVNFSKAGAVYTKQSSGTVGDAVHKVTETVRKFIFG